MRVRSQAYLPPLLARSIRVCSNILTSALTSSLTVGGSARGKPSWCGCGVPALLLLFPCWLSCHILCHISAWEHHYSDQWRQQHAHNCVSQQQDIQLIWFLDCLYSNLFTVYQRKHLQGCHWHKGTLLTGNCWKQWTPSTWNRKHRNFWIHNTHIYRHIWVTPPGHFW